MNPIVDEDKKTILVVDDEDSLAIFLEKLLKSEGYNVFTASNGKEAVEIYKTNKENIDLVLMDVTMPIMTGLEAHREITQFDPCAPILLMSAYSQDAFEGLTHPHFIQKPMRPTELFESINLAIEKSAQCNE